ncbi:putative enzyme related to lactoylglutathione lyase [Actinoplanes octamycinicus]|uniref:Putative enzyme related to lactoylglutathione lyase n=1 Tax=Actinoplanes octamycinicus TaxID=135948 RepID=A0A7W7H3E4_9ACTN|nr:VOC family protein [Actinoplanes octamycinicus]MBB4743278.1 putative enzyme related to lactoylglutathione lyase [Actinoplanes octamycinicus]GIE61792.1 glyoxalase [Actinoplanes octamycinicus]
MLRGVAKVRIGVRDQERAKRFWTETVKCEVVQDQRYGDERWLEVRLPDGVVLILERADGPDPAAADGQPNTPVFLACDDVDATWRELTDRGVSFVQEPIDMPFGRWALLEDSEGNRFPLLATRG